MPSDVREKRNAIAALTLLVAVLAGADAIAAPEICGSDPAILTPLYPIRSTPSGPRLGPKPDITFTFEGQKPCSGTCRIVLRRGVSGQVIGSVRIPSGEAIYCRNADPFLQLSKFPGDDKLKECGGGVYESYRLIKSGSARGSSLPAVSIALSQYERPGKKPIYRCRGPSSGDADVFEGRVRRLATESNALLRIIEHLPQGAARFGELLYLHLNSNVTLKE